MKAVLLFQEKRTEASGAIVEMTIWRVPSPVPPSTHGLKYSLFYGRAGQRIVAFDNERGKGDHMHIDGVERPYQFTTVEQLVTDFFAHVAERETQDE
ncbi:DUF6516 family protein [Sandarakinorhabdus sp.]|uniref:toxin-antitoxin system TumE family protein n=1 Tax=Sandarakinorhabdus sp. TaxID=1916663 RepID=UPI003341B9E8